MGLQRVCRHGRVLPQSTAGARTRRPAFRRTLASNGTGWVVIDATPGIGCPTGVAAGPWWTRGAPCLVVRAMAGASGAPGKPYSIGGTRGSPSLGRRGRDGVTPVLRLGRVGVRDRRRSRAVAVTGAAAGGSDRSPPAARRRTKQPDSERGIGTRPGQPTGAGLPWAVLPSSTYPYPPGGRTWDTFRKMHHAILFAVCAEQPPTFNTREVASIAGCSDPGEASSLGRRRAAPWWRSR